MLWLLAPILFLLAVLGVWANHFESSFHVDDLHTVVNNGAALGSLTNVPRFFTDPRLSADQSEYAHYQPLLTSSLAVDYYIAGGPAATVFQIDTFAWFLLDLLALYLLFALIPGAGHRTALLGTALFAFHPVAADTVNYVSRRGSVMGAFGLLAGMTVWIVWSKHMPERLMHFDAVPKTAWDEFRKIWTPRINTWYRSFINLPLGLYLIPVVLAMLSDPTAAVFAPILTVYLLLFDRDRVSRRILPAAVVCGGYWIFQLLFTWRFGEDLRQPFLSYLVTQPLVIVRYLYSFFIPVDLSAAGHVVAIGPFWSPLALAGDAGLVAIVWLAIVTSRSAAWRIVSFGIWWFLIALAPASLIPQNAFEDDGRMYLAMVGLALASARAIWILIDRLAAVPSRRMVALVSASSLILLLLAGCAWATFARTAVWSSETSLWENATANSPHNPTGFIRYASALTATGATDEAYLNLEKAASLMKDDPVEEVALAQEFDAVNRSAEAEQHFKLAVDSFAGGTRGKRYPPALSYYAEWLLLQGRDREAFTLATRAIQIDPRSLAARHTLMEFYSKEDDWPAVKRVAEETLRLEPADGDALRARELAQSVSDRLAAAERKAAHATSADEFLSLSVAYFQNRRFEDSIEACRRALAIHPDLAEAYSNIAAADYAMGRLDDSETALRQTLRLRPDMASAKKNLDYILLLKSQPKTAAR